MTDNVALNVGSGTTFTAATDDVAGVHYQRVKLVNGTLDATEAIPGDASNGLDVDVTRLPSLPAGTAYVGKVRLTDGTNDVTLEQMTGDAEDGTHWAVPSEAYNMAFNGSTWDRVRGDATNGLYVQVKAEIGAIADDAAFTPGTTPVRMVGFTLDDTATDLVDEGDSGAARMTADRRQIVQLGESGAKDVVGGGSKTDGTDQAVMAAGAAGVFNYLCWLTVYNSSATNTYATLKDGSTTRAVIPLPAYGGAVLQWPRGLRSTAATAWNVAAGASVTTAYFYGGGYAATA